MAWAVLWEVVSQHVTCLLLSTALLTKIADYAAWDMCVDSFLETVFWNFSFVLNLSDVDNIGELLLITSCLLLVTAG